VARTSGVTAQVSCPEACELQAAALIDAPTARRIKLPPARRLAVVAQDGAVLKSPGTATLTFVLPAEIRKAFGRAGSLTLRIDLKATDPDGNRRDIFASTTLS
jgi:hypothetical protein